MLAHTRSQNEAAGRVLGLVEGEVGRLEGSHKRLERECVGRWEEAERVREGAERSWEVLRLARGVGRVVGLARQVEGLVGEGKALGVGGGREEFKSLVRAAYVSVGVREVLEGQEGRDLVRVNVVRSLRSEVFGPYEERIKSRAQQTVREFAMSSLGQGSNVTFAQTEDAKAKTTSAAQILYLLSTVPVKGPRPWKQEFQPELLLRTQQHYLQNALTSSSASIGRALSELPTLQRTLREVSARCQNIVALESLLADVKAPEHPLLADGEDVKDAARNLLDPLLHSLDTSSLPSYFWRSLASSLGPRVQDILSRGGVSARTLRSNRDRVRDEIRQCVLQGSQMPSGVMSRSGGQMVGAWEREAAVMIGSVVGPLGR